MLKHFLFYFLIPLLAGSLHSIYAQTIEGRVTDATSGEPLEGTTIIETGTTNGTSAGSDGTFSLTLISDADEITVSFVGYQTVSIPLQIPDQFLEISLDEQVIMSGEVFVSALRVDDSTPIAYTNISREEIESRNLRTGYSLLDSDPHHRLFPPPMPVQESVIRVFVFVAWILAELT
jgi:iron complex outermembrane recepter protein